MRLLVNTLALAILASAATTASADLIFSIGPAASSVPLNGMLTFDVNFTSSVANQQVQAIDMSVLSGVGDGTEGVFTAGSVDIGSGFWDVTFPGEAYLTFTLAFDVPNFYDTGSVGSIHKLGELTLDLNGVAIGAYQITMHDLLVLDPSISPINSSSLPGSFTVVPEPSSLAMILGISGLLMIGRSRRRVA